MDRKDTLSIMTVLKAAYPNFYYNMSMRDANAAVDLWADMFQKEPVGLVGAAVKALIESDVKGYPPHIGAVKEKIRLITGRDDNQSEMEAWNMVSKAICRGIYHSKEDFEKLPSDIRDIIGSPDQIRQWAIMDSDTVQSVVASNFQRAYRVKAKRKEAFDRLPEDVKKLATEFSKKLMIKEG